MKLSNAIRSERADLLASALADGTLELRTGAAPASPQVADAGTLLGTIALPDPAFLAAVDGVLAKTGTWAGTGAIAAGTGTTIGHARFKNLDGDAVMDCSVSLGSGSGELKLSIMTLAHTQAVSVISFGYTEGNA